MASPSTLKNVLGILEILIGKTIQKLCGIAFSFPMSWYHVVVLPYILVSGLLHPLCSQPCDIIIF